ncbi:O-antigen polymerase [Butyricimonas faecihominis]|uniref:O-antigen polymerase n=1 Tax=Butyricimonas faecihominis TaxID=1472416 RepID=UPI0032BF43EB
MVQIISNINIVAYILIWIVTIIVYQKKKKQIDAGTICMVSFFCYAVASLFLYNDNKDDFNPVHFFPFLYLYLMLMLASYPILKYDTLKIRKIQTPNLLFVKMLVLIFIMTTLVRLPDILMRFSEGLKLMMIDIAAAGDIYNETMADSNATLGDGTVSNLSAIISNCFSNLGILLLFYYLTLNKQNKFLVLGLLLSCITLMLGNIAISQRGPVVDILLNLVITYYAFRKFLSDKVKLSVKWIGGSVLILVLVAILALTIGRFQNWGKGPLASVYGYIGQQNLYFNKYGLDNGGIRYGDRTFPLFKQLLGFENVPKSFWERREKYHNLKINDEKFISFVGDFTLDFGPYIAPIIFVLLTLFVLRRTKIRNGEVAFHQLILLHLVMCICVQGGLKLYSFADTGNLQIILYLVLYYIFRFDRDYRLLQSRKMTLGTISQI